MVSAAADASEQNCCEQEDILRFISSPPISSLASPGVLISISGPTPAMGTHHAGFVFSMNLVFIPSGISDDAFHGSAVECWRVPVSPGTMLLACRRHREY
jgi:hypothetical protein